MNANELKAQFNTWVRSMTPRERLMVAAASVLIVIALIWLLLLNPLYSSQEQLAQRVNGKSTLLVELQQRAASRVSQPATSNIQGLDQSIVVVIDRTTRLRGLSPYLKRNQPDGNNTVRLTV